MPTIEQIRAARALIGWSQSDLAEQANLSQTGIARIENGTNQPNSTTIEKIRTAFDKADIEFIGDTGVKKRTGEIRTLDGVSGFRAFIDDLYETTKETGKMVYLYNARPKNWHDWLGKDWWDLHSARMTKLNDKAQRIFIAEDDTYLISSAFSEHRYFPKELFNDQSIYAYGDKIAFVTFSDTVRIRILDNKQFCDGFRVLLDIAWNNVAKPQEDS